MRCDTKHPCTIHSANASEWKDKRCDACQSDRRATCNKRDCRLVKMPQLGCYDGRHLLGLPEKLKAHLHIRSPRMLRNKRSCHKMIGRKWWNLANDPYISGRYLPQSFRHGYPYYSICEVQCSTEKQKYPYRTHESSA